MPRLAQLTVPVLIVSLAIAPAAHASMRLEQPVVIAPTAAPAPVVVAPSAAPATVVVAPTPVAAPSQVAPTEVVVAPSTTTVVTPSSWNAIAAAPGTAVTVTTTTTTTTTTSAPVVTPAAPAVVSPQHAVRNLLRYDPYLAPRYRSGRNMLIGGAVATGIGAATLLTTLSWASFSRNEIRGAFDSAERRRVADERNRYVPVARVVGTVGAILVVTGFVLIATGAIKRRRAIEEARGRVFMQAGPGGMQVRF